MGKSNVDIQASDEVSYDSLLKSPALHQNRKDYSMQQIISVIDEVIKRTGKKELHVLELGFGDGKRFKELCRIYPEAVFVGLEVREKPVGNMVALGYDCRLVETEKFDFFFDTGETFDIIYGFGVIHHMSDPYKSFESLIKLLKPGGVIQFFGEHHKYDLLSHLYTTIKGNWLYEKNVSKVKRRGFKKLLEQYTAVYRIGYDNNGFTVCFKRFNKIYCRLKLHRVPLWNCMTIFARIDKKDNNGSDN